ncbi:MAG: PD-(D/E)XK nuclease family protein [Rikenellaceae bacterium]|nr:PD-(D/E)XK nuclease family protein [Rikenellaceae bacterium]
MQTFLGDVARDLYGRYGDGIHDLRIIFPSRRARIFFNNELVAIADKPIWQPEYLSVDDLMEQIAGVGKSESVRLLAELYKAYGKFHDESFDSFYFWGEMLLADFDTIDKYRIDARTLFVNIADLKDMERDLSYLNEEQIAIVKKFWKNFAPEDMSSPEKRNFTNIWNTLYDIYTLLRNNLLKSGMAYTGMVYREAADKVKNNTLPETVNGKRYAIIGFNALTECEKIVFDYLKNTERADFYWDYDIYYTEYRSQESGLFLRDNIKRYPSPLHGSNNNFTRKKNITVVSAPSDVMQAKYTSDFLEKTIHEGQIPDKDTAIVLTDENLLIPVLHSIPDRISDVNITMGYPLKLSPAYTLLEKLIGLQQRRKISANSCFFYHNDIKGIFNHPYISLLNPDLAERKRVEVDRRQQIYLSAGILSDGDELALQIFTAVEGWEALCDYFIDIFNYIFDKFPQDASNGYVNKDFLITVSDRVAALKNSLNNCGLEISDKVLLSLLRKSLNSVRVPFEGEPLKGVQVMGILETRNIDFKNVLLLSANDDTFPGNLSVSSSFVPYSLRLAYGLPTPQHHEGVYGYYFYRLIQRAENVCIVYSAKADDKKTGEPSRYIYQLDYESPHDVKFETISLNVNIGSEENEPIRKNEEILRLLDQFAGVDAVRSLSPSAFYGYVECPVKFYYQTLARISEDDEITEEVDLPMFGNILHKAAEIIYGTVKGDPLGVRILKEYEHVKIKEAVEEAVRAEYFREDNLPEEIGGNITMIMGIVIKYLSRCVLRYDIENPHFTVAENEFWINTFIDVGGKNIKLGGKIDRLDVLHDGKMRIVDYKTGKSNSQFSGVEALFSNNFRERNPAVLQTLIYSFMVRNVFGKEVVPSLYYVRHMNEVGFSPLLADVSQKGKRIITEYSDIADELEAGLRLKLTELFDPEIPFERCKDSKTCDYCPFKNVCR